VLTGHTIKGRYRIYDRLGMGGAATVYLARDTTSGRMVVVKVVHPHLVNDQFIARFEREIDLLQQIQSPYIIRLYDWALRDYDDVLHESLSYIVTEFVQGHTLADIIDTRGKMDEEAALAIARQLALALAEVHDRGIIHRDVKSQNIMITPANEAKLIDFGIAKGPDHATLTDPAHFAGTLYYAPPEQIIEARNVDHRADLYALGVVLYEMLTASLPVQEKDFGAIASKIISGDLVPITGVSEEVTVLVDMMMAPNLAERVGSADEVVQRIEAILGSATELVLPERPPSRDETVALKRSELGMDEVAPIETGPLDVSSLGYRLVTDDGREILLEKPDTIVGRSHPRDAVAPDIDLNALGLEHARTASRRHCRLFIENGVCFLEDLGSMNGTRLNDVRLEAGNLYRLSPDDLISAGQVLLTFRAPPQ
jgi:serine/threonine-protein kinase